MVRGLSLLHPFNEDGSCHPWAPLVGTAKHGHGSVLADQANRYVAFLSFQGIGRLQRGATSFDEEKPSFWQVDCDTGKVKGFEYFKGAPPLPPPPPEPLEPRDPNLPPLPPPPPPLPGCLPGEEPMCTPEDADLPQCQPPPPPPPSPKLRAGGLLGGAEGAQESAGEESSGGLLGGSEETQESAESGEKSEEGALFGGGGGLLGGDQSDEGGGLFGNEKSEGSEGSEGGSGGSEGSEGSGGSEGSEGSGGSGESSGSNDLFGSAASQGTQGSAPKAPPPPPPPRQKCIPGKAIPEPSQPCQIKQGLCCHKCRSRADCKLCLEWKEVLGQIPVDVDRKGWAQNICPAAANAEEADDKDLDKDYLLPEQQ